MKQILIIILSCFFGQASIAQSDSVYLSIDSKLISEIQIITPYGQNGSRENYTYFKYRYWLGEIDTVSMTVIDETKPAKSKKKAIQYQKCGACDSIINKIRNSAEYWKMFSEIDKIARQEIGYNNEEFNKFKYSENSRLNDFSEKCQNEFRIEIAELKDKLLKEINRIREDKYQRLTQLKERPESIDSTSITSFFETFDLCETDLKTLELIILNNPTDFVNFIDGMNDSEFFTFTLKLDDFPEDSNVSLMKETLKESEQKSKRKKKVIRKIKKTKG
ncbi:MAG: hypothetical protein ACOCWB_02890 [Bacteroidota bacterium]